MEPKKVKVIKLKKKYAIILVIALLGIFGIVAGSSYAFFTSSINGKEYVVYSGTLEIGYEKKTNTINIPNATPMSNADGLLTTPYSFDVKNNGTLAAKYQVRLEEDTKNTLPLEYVKISVYKNDIEYLKPTKLSNLNSNLVIVDNGLLDASGTDNYKVRLWVDLGAGNDVVGKEFKARIVIDGMQDVADGFDINTRPVITLNKQNNNTHINLIKGATFTDPGVESVKDDKDVLKKSDITITYEYYDGTNLTTVNSIDTSNTGVYYITYSILDNDGLAGSTIRVVTVNPTATTPTISLNGAATLNLNQLDTYIEAGATVAQGVKVATIGEVKLDVPGTYVIRYIAIDENNNMNSVTRTINVTHLAKNSWDFAYSGSAKTFTVPTDGIYQVELWGATGAQISTGGGYGGYVKGNITLTKNTDLYVYVGGIGKKRDYNDGVGIIEGGYNGGGDAYVSRISCSQAVGSGGGSTDIRLVGGEWNNFDSLKSRIMVAAGGGGAFYDNCSASDTTSRSGGIAGGLNGGDATIISNGSSWTSLTSTGATQTTGGRSVDDYKDSYFNGVTSTYYSGSFGYGASGTESYRYHDTANEHQSAAGGGGGYYGGASGGWQAASGGSSFISGHNGCNAISESSTSTNIVHTDQPNHYSGYVFTNTQIIDGGGYSWTTTRDSVEPMPMAQAGQYFNNHGNTSYGYARITYLGKN